MVTAARLYRCRRLCDKGVTTAIDECTCPQVPASLGPVLKTGAIAPVNRHPESQGRQLVTALEMQPSRR